MANETVLWLTETDVASLVSLNEAIAVLKQIILEEAQNKATNVSKALGVWDGGSLHALGGVAPGLGYGCFKTWINTPKGAMAVVTLFDTETGRWLAVIEAATLGSLRTAGVSGLATDWLANPAASEMALIGTGRQALLQIAVVSTVRKLERVRVFSPRPESRQRFLEQARPSFSFPLEEATSLEEAVRDNPIVTLVTRASQPFLSASMLSPGTHLNAVGAILLANAEFETKVFERVSLYAVDNVENTLKNSREFKTYFEQNGRDRAEIPTLGQLMLQGRQRTGPQEITLFKPMGMGLSDLAVAITVYERARQTGQGKEFPYPVPQLPRWNSL
jgi:ornithine cyclodeaminase